MPNLTPRVGLTTRDISHPYNAINQYDGKSIPETKAFENRYSQSYQRELIMCKGMDVPRVKLGDALFKESVMTWGREDGLKWVYTVYRDLYIIPCEHLFYGFEPSHAYAADNSPVFCAGTAEFKDSSNVLTVNHWSGHYCPSDASLKFHMQYTWEKVGIPIKQVGI